MAETHELNGTQPNYIGASDVEKAHPRYLERAVTPGGHPIDYSQPAIPPQHVSGSQRTYVALLTVVCFSANMVLLLLWVSLALGQVSS